MNQRERAIGIVQRVRELGVTRGVLTDLSDVLDEAQNPLPDGHADGSIPEELWRELMRFLKACNDLHVSADRIRVWLEGHP